MPVADKALERYADEYRDDPEFIAEGLATRVTDRVSQLLDDEGHTQTWLAGTMRVSRAHVSRILNAPSNLTLLSIAKLAVALSVPPEKLLAPIGSRYIWAPQSALEDRVLDARAVDVSGSSASSVGTWEAITTGTTQNAA